MQNLKIALTLVLLAMAVGVSPAQAIDFDFPKESHVLGAVVMMYAAMPEDHSAWLEAVCENMTGGGCGYFTDNLESMLWQIGQGVAGDSAWPSGGMVATLDDGSQVWRAAVTIYKDCRFESEDVQEDCQCIKSDIYLHVIYDEIQDKWLLNRVLYGPYIDFPQFEEQ